VWALDSGLDHRIVEQKPIQVFRLRPVFLSDANSNSEMDTRTARLQAASDC